MFLVIVIPLLALTIFYSACCFLCVVPSPYIFEIAAFQLWNCLPLEKNLYPESIFGKSFKKKYIYIDGIVCVLNKTSIDRRELYIDDENKPGDLIMITVFCPHYCFCFHKINAALSKHKLIFHKQKKKTIHLLYYFLNNSLLTNLIIRKELKNVRIKYYRN